MGNGKQTAQDTLAAVLGAWRLWVIGAFAGALLAAGVYAVAPPDYRAQATVLVDLNLEEAWTYFPDRQLFQFTRRETARLREVAWSDEALGVVAEATGVSVAELRDGALELSQPGDGGWHFYGVAPEAEAAQSLAAAWAGAFVRGVRDAVVVSPELEAARDELRELAASEPEAGDERLGELLEEITRLYEASEGVSPYVEASVSQGADLPLERSVSLAGYLLVGSIVGAAAAGFIVVWREKG
jgi:hypothetical protein